jgi:iron complex outermembrane receptor protein
VTIINRQGVVKRAKNTVLLWDFIVAVSLASSTMAFTEESGNSALTPILRLETMSVTGSRIGRVLGEDSEAISVIGGEDIELIGPSHINEVLNNVPGVWLSRGNGQEHLTAIRSAVLTGPGSCGTFYFAEDGIPLRGHGFCNVNALFDTNSEQAGQIEVLRGPGTVVHGSNAVNGIINVISQAPPEQSESRISIEGGPHDYRRLKLQNGGIRI